MYEQEIDSLHQELNALPPLTKGSEERLKSDFAISFAYNSNAIEGSNLTEHETYLILNDGMSIADKPLKYQMDAFGHKNAFDFAFERAAQGAALDETLIKDIHARILRSLPDAAGVYRDIPCRIAGSDAAFSPPAEILSEMRHLINEYEGAMQRYHISRRIAVFHLRFVTVHPFVDGNGRTGRLLMNFDLLKHGFPPIDIKLRDRARYYDCIRAYDRDGDDLSLTRLVQEYLKDALLERVALTKTAALMHR
ncbi:MAG TPA: Fic family protein [Clostridia bacterium]|nr:Fic family protein [Clostridia bacterium]